jgi:hypothetical protein
MEGREEPTEGEVTTAAAVGTRELVAGTTALGAVDGTVANGEEDGIAGVCRVPGRAPRAGTTKKDCTNQHHEERHYH